MTKTIKVMLLDYEQINYDCDNGFVSDYELRKRLTELKKTHSRFMWLNDYSNNIAKTSVVNVYPYVSGEFTPLECHIKT